MYLILNINSRCVTSKPRSDSAGRNPSPMPPRKKPAAAAKSAPRRQPAKPKSGTKAKGARKSISKPAITGKPESKAFTKKLVKVKQEVKKEKIRQANLRAKQRAADDTVCLFGSQTWFLGLPRMRFKLVLIGLYGIKKNRTAFI